MINATLQSEPKYLTTVRVGKHIQILDEPVSLGGNDQGPTPVQSIYSALAGCICMTLRIYAEGKKWPLEKIEVHIDTSKKAVKSDDERFQDKPWMIDKGKVRFIHAVIYVHGNLDKEQVERLDVMAGKCPVHKMLKHGSFVTHETLHASSSAE